MKKSKYRGLTAMMSMDNLVMQKYIFIIGLLFMGFIFSLGASCQNLNKNALSITVNKQKMYMGKSVMVHASFTPPSGKKAKDFILLPFVNKRRWGAFEFPNAKGKATFILPLPNIGNAQIQVIALPKSGNKWYGMENMSLLRTGTVMPEKGINSNSLDVDVRWRNFPKRKKNKSIFAMEWEPWFSPKYDWSSAQAVPLMGFYSDTDMAVIRQQMLWFMEIGVDCLILDWSNHIWGAKHWNERTDRARAIVHQTMITLEVLATMRDEGLPVPKVVLMPGLSNGNPTTMGALNEQFNWIYQNFVRNPRFHGLWQHWNNKPLIITLDTQAIANKEAKAERAYPIPFFRGKVPADSLDKYSQQQVPVDDQHFTVRWMSSQNQITGYEKFGYWSWMDGSLKPVVTYRDGTPEVVTVSTALFSKGGWTAKTAYGRRNGWTYLQNFQTAEKVRPAFVLLHQFNEYSGAKGQGRGPDNNIYTDTYSVELSDDIEPVSLTAPGYRGNGGWGFFYLNMTKAFIDLYNNKSKATIMAISPPDISDDQISFNWTSVGPNPKSYSIYIDGKVVAKDLKKSRYSYPSEKLSSGDHTVKVIANGVKTRYKLSKYHIDSVLEKPVPVVVKEHFNVK